MLSMILAAALLAAGCGGRKASMGAGASARANAPGPQGKVMVTPERVLTGRVERVNAAGHFVVVSFPVGQLPAAEQVLSVYRNGLKVGEVKVTAMSRDDNVVADLWKGEAEVGDEVRSR